MSKEINIAYSTVKSEVLRLSEYIGLKAGAFDKLRAIDEDNDQLKHWADEGMTIVGTVLDRVIAKKVTWNAESTPNNWTLTLSHENDNSALLQGAIERVVETHIITRWLKLVAPQLVEAYTGDFIQARDELTRLAYFREMPK